jgi:glycosyltransferase involved in cell wall biosynthesis
MKTGPVMPATPFAKATLIVPTYNRPAELTLCLRSLVRQSVLPHEVVVADDGSGEETRRAVRMFAELPGCPFPVRHVWQEDIGFRKPRILNEAARNATGDYLIFLDGDCMAHRHFVREHFRRAGPEWILGGRRVELGRELTARILAEGEPVSGLSFRLLRDSLTGGTRKAEEALRIHSPFLRRILRRDRITDDGIWGCNFSIPKELFYRINGCDEDFLDGSIEDNDLGIRVLNSGGQVRSVRALAVVFHLWHPASWNFQGEKYLFNRRILERRIAGKEIRCVNGIDRRAAGSR